MTTISEKTNILRKEFLEIDVNHDEFITQEELYTYLDKKSGKEFERNVAQQIYDRMDKDYNGRVTIDEFIKVYLEAEEILRSKIENSRQHLEEYHRQLREASAKYDEIRQTELQNQYGIMENSTLTVGIIEVENLRQDVDQVQPLIILTCDKQRHTTQQGSGPSYVFNDTAKFNIITGMEDLHILIQDNNRRNNLFVGQLSIPLNRVKDQYKHDEWFDLYNNDGQLDNIGRIHLSIQWIHSKVKYLNDIIKKWEEQIQTTVEDLDDYERDLSCLYEPFPALVKVYKGEMLAQNQLMINGENKVMNRQPYENQEVKAIPLTNQTNKNKDLVLYARIIAIIMLMLAINVCVYRAQFFDLLGIFFFIVFYQRNLLSRNVYFALLAAFVVSFMMDLIWLIIFSKHWWTGSKNIYADSTLEISIKRYVIIMSYLLFFAKLAFIAILWLLTQSPTNLEVEVKKDEESTNQPQQEEINVQQEQQQQIEQPQRGSSQPQQIQPKQQQYLSQQPVYQQQQIKPQTTYNPQIQYSNYYPVGSSPTRQVYNLPVYQ